MNEGRLPAESTLKWSLQHGWEFRAAVDGGRLNLSLRKEDGIYEVGRAQIRPTEVGAQQVSLTKISAPEVGPDEAGRP